MSAIALNFIQATRTDKKGKVTVRDLLGIIASGNRKERDAAVSSLITHYWTEGQFAPLAGQITRAFGKDVLPAFGFFGLGVATGTITDNKIEGLTNRGAWSRIFAGLNEAHAKKAYKGERLLLLTAINNALATEKAQVEAKAAAAAANQAQADAGLVDVDATEVQPLQLANESERVNADAETV